MIRRGNIGEIPGFTAVLMLYPGTGTVVAITSTDDQIDTGDLLHLADPVNTFIKR